MNQGQPERTIVGIDVRALAGSAIVAVTATVLLGAWWGTTPLSGLDTSTHLEVARDLADGQLSSMPNAAPGYPLVLIVTGSLNGPGRGLLIAQILMHFATIVFVLSLASRFKIGWRWLIVLSALMVAPPMMEPVFSAATETAATFFLMAGTVTAVHWYDSRRLPWLFASGVLFGFSALVRPSFQAVGIVVAVVAGVASWRRRRSLPRVAAVSATALLGTVLLVGGAVLYNYSRFDYPGLTPLTGWHLMTRTGAYLDDIPDSDKALREALIRVRNREMTASGNNPTPNRMLWRYRSEVEAATGLSPRDLDRKVQALDMQLIARNPMGYVQIVGASIPAYMSPGATKRSFGGSPTAQGAMALPHLALLLLFWIQLWFVSVIPMARRLGARVRNAFAPPGTKFIYVLSLAIVAYTLAISTMFDVGEPRYRAPTDGLILVLIFAGASVMQTVLRERTPATGSTRALVTEDLINESSPPPLRAQRRPSEASDDEQRRV